MDDEVETQPQESIPTKLPDSADDRISALKAAGLLTDKHLQKHSLDEIKFLRVVVLDWSGNIAKGIILKPPKELDTDYQKLIMDISDRKQLRLLQSGAESYIRDALTFLKARAESSNTAQPENTPSQFYDSVQETILEKAKTVGIEISKEEV